MSSLSLQGLRRTYSATVAVDRVDLDMAQGELVALLGPSGCGKTTTLRMVAGFVLPSAGRVLIGGQDVSRAPPYARDTGMVFQGYALFPHMTVADNVGFGLEMRRVGRAERATRIAEALRLVRLDGLAERRPAQLSGGQQQRVALARALVVNPSVFLLDEPLSNLDARLRAEVRVEIRALQQRLGLTTLFVTHDQEEALTMADRLVVMDRGRVRQTGSPEELYERPDNLLQHLPRHGGAARPAARRHRRAALRRRCAGRALRPGGPPRARRHRPRRGGRGGPARPRRAGHLSGRPDRLAYRHPGRPRAGHPPDPRRGRCAAAPVARRAGAAGLDRGRRPAAGR